MQSYKLAVIQLVNIYGTQFVKWYYTYTAPSGGLRMGIKQKLAKRGEHEAHTVPLLQLFVESLASSDRLPKPLNEVRHLIPSAFHRLAQ
jgi:hypothetical protein